MLGEFFVRYIHSLMLYTSLSFGEQPSILTIIYYTLTLEAADSTDQSSFSSDC